MWPAATLYLKSGSGATLLGVEFGQARFVNLVSPHHQTCHRITPLIKIEDIARTTTTRAGRIKSGSQERREKQKQELREKILTAAGAEFLEHGYEEFSLRRVAERIGYSATTIYLYFENKDDLLLATVQDGFKAFDASVEAAAAANADPLRRIVALGQAYMEFGLANPAIYRLMFMQRADFYLLPRLTGTGSEPEIRQAALDGKPGDGTYHVIAQELLVGAVKEAMDAGQITPGDPLLTADALWAGAHGLVALASSPIMAPDHARKVLDRYAELVIAGLKYQAE